MSSWQYVYGDLAMPSISFLPWGTHVSFIFSGYNLTHILRDEKKSCKPWFLGSQGRYFCLQVTPPPWWYHIIHKLNIQQRQRSKYIYLVQFIITITIKTCLFWINEWNQSPMISPGSISWVPKTPGILFSPRCQSWAPSMTQWAKFQAKPM